MTTGAQAFGGRRSIAKFMVATALIAAPMAGISFSASAAPSGTPSHGVLSAPVPADPPPNTPPPPPPPQQPAPPAGGNGGDYYCGGCDGGAGGGGGGGG
jgi:hypothetical protein